MKKVELLAPAGNLEKLKMAVVYGADAVYVGGEEFGLRAYADNFSISELKKGIDFAHSYGKKVYLTMNIIPHNEDIISMKAYAEEIKDLAIDAIIVSDPGALMVLKQVMPNMEFHLSTQANCTNWQSALFWYSQGVRRIVLARELSLKEISFIKKNIPDDLELEIFVHGAMCISYSGRCLLSSYMAARNSNKGDCAHPCRWKYVLEEEKRPGVYMPVFENDRGTFIFNSKDLCMIEHIPDIVETGVTSIKIEGRIKSSYYVATVVKAYREALDEYYKDPENYKFKQEWMEELEKSSHREFTTGFYFGKPDENTQVYSKSSYIRTFDFVGLVKDYDNKTKIATVEQRNRMYVGDEVEVVTPRGHTFTQKIEEMRNEENVSIEVAPHPQMILYIPMKYDVSKFSILRREIF